MPRRNSGETLGLRVSALTACLVLPCKHALDRLLTALKALQDWQVAFALNIRAAKVERAGRFALVLATGWWGGSIDEFLRLRDLRLRGLAAKKHEGGDKKQKADCTHTPSWRDVAQEPRSRTYPFLQAFH
jgi:hypothetical protein